ncbi:MAG: transglycosylase SLT domain-containing protein [Phycisphaerales bacterium]|nr:transglycosylase SLT domain-containing protein [Phycisphaerales bacterium]
MTRSNILTVLFVALAALGFTPIASAHYDPVPGRWLERDPIRYADGMNSYQYVASNPLSHVDPHGLQAEGVGITQKVGDPSRRFEDIWHSIEGCIPDMSRRIKVYEGEGKNRKLVDQIDQSINDARDTISKELLMCLFAMESDFDPDARSDVPAVGLGQMTKVACDEVDRVLKRPAGTCWASQTGKPGFSQQICDQIANTATYLAILLAKQTGGDFKEALKRYGPKDAPYGEYSDPIRECEKCLKGKPKCHEQAYPGGPDRKDCFDKAKKARNDERQKRKQ